MRGLHWCHFCDVESPIRLALADGTRVVLGMSEIHVTGPSGARYSAPTLIHHYVTAHNYRPLLDFQKAVLDHAAALEHADGS